MPTIPLVSDLPYKIISIMIHNDPTTLTDAEAAYQQRNFSHSLELCLESLSVKPGHVRAFNLLLRIANKKKDLVDIPTLSKVTDSFIAQTASNGVATAKYWPLISLANKYLMRAKLDSSHQFIRYLNSTPHKKKDKPKFLILTCVWQRHNLTDLFYRYYAGLRDKLSSDMEINLISVGSEGKLSKAMCERYGFSYVERDNEPLTAKWQAGIDAIRELDFDALIILGSDDFICEKTFYMYKTIFNQGALFFGFRDLHLYNAKTTELGHWKGYGSASHGQSQPLRVGETIGLGRFLSRTLLKYLDFNLWKSVSAPKGLDGIMRERIQSETQMLPVDDRHSFKLVPSDRSYQLGLLSTTLDDNGLCGLDVKSDENVTAFARYIMSPDCYQTMATENLERLFRQIVHELKILQ